MVKKKDEIGEAPPDKPEGATQESDPKTTPGEVVTLSPKELEDRINAGRADLGRQLKSSLLAQSAIKTQYDDAVKRITAFETNLNSMREKDRQRELELAKDNPELLDAYKVRHKAEDLMAQAQKARSELEGRESQFHSRLEASMKTEAQTLAKELAEDSGLTADLILQIGTDTADGQTTYNLERMRQIAKSVPKEDEEEEETEKVKGQRTIASRVHSSNKGLTTMEDYDRAYNEGHISVKEYGEARIRFGVAY